MSHAQERTDRLMMKATITTNPTGQLTDDSTCTIDGRTTPVPTWVNRGSRAAPPRIWAAIKTLGYVPVNYYDTIEQHNGYVTVTVKVDD